MKWKSASEIRIFRWLAVIMVLIIAVPIGWKIAANQRAEIQAAADDHARILAAVTEGRTDQAWLWARIYIKNDRATATSLQDLGGAFLDAGRPVEAFLLLDASAQKESDAATLALMARACLAEGRSFEAVSYADRAVSGGAGGRSGYTLLGDCLAADGRAADAVTAYSHVLERYPFDREALRGKADAFQAIQRYAQAQLVWDVLIERLVADGTDESRISLRYASLRRAICLDGEKKTAEALKAWTGLLASAKADGNVDLQREALFGLARHALAADDTTGAADRYRETVRISTGADRTEARLQLSLCLVALDRTDEARQEVIGLVAESTDAVARIFAEEAFAPLRAFFL
jgi:tetratricopeptide (TPR) repeat protein